MIIKKHGMTMEDGFLTGNAGGLLYRCHFAKWWRLGLWFRWFTTPVHLRKKITMYFSNGTIVACQCLAFEEGIDRIELDGMNRSRAHVAGRGL